MTLRPTTAGGESRERLTLEETMLDGRPIPDQERDQIFDAYRRSANSRGNPSSVGLGLTVSRRLARLMDGDVVYDHDGAESIFRLLLPLSPPQTTDTNQAVA